MTRGSLQYNYTRYSIIIPDIVLPADDGGHQDEDDHLGDVVDVALVLAVPDPNLSVESLDVAEEAGVEGDENCEGEEEHDCDEREHVDADAAPGAIPFTVIRIHSTSAMLKLINSRQ